jgi:methyl-accepting chemotaxis protein
MGLFKLTVLKLLRRILKNQKEFTMTFAEYAEQQAAANAGVMTKLDEQHAVIADELNEVSEKITALEETIRNGEIDAETANALLEQTAAISAQLTAATESIENILPEAEEPEPVPEP